MVLEDTDRGPGRPRLSHSEARSVTVRARVRPDLHKLLEDAAEENGVSASREMEQRLMDSFAPQKELGPAESSVQWFIAEMQAELKARLGDFWDGENQFALRTLQQVYGEAFAIVIFSFFNGEERPANEEIQAASALSVALRYYVSQNAHVLASIQDDAQKQKMLDESEQVLKSAIERWRDAKASFDARLESEAVDRTG